MIEMSKQKTTSYVFIPGKNWKLSLAELLSFFEARKYNFRITDLSKSHFVIAGEEPLEGSCINDLGGFTKIGLVIALIPSQIVDDAFLHMKKEAQIEFESRLSSDLVFKEIFKTTEKCVFGVSLYFENPVFNRISKKTQRFLGRHFKKDFAAHGLRARFMGFPKNRKLPQLSHVEVLKKGLVEKSAEILCCIGEEQTVIANTIAVHNPFEFQKRDIDRPIQRKIFAIPPRLAKIMVNLSLCSPGKVLLDPFCGVGTILQEAVLAKAQTIGIDINPWCAEASRKNLEWLKSEYNLANAKYTVMFGDSRNLARQIGKEAVDCVATEPDLGPALRHIPTVSHASRIVDTLEPLYFGFLEETYKALRHGGRLVFVAPYIRTRIGEFVTLNIEEKARGLGFKTVSPFKQELFAEGNRLTGSLIERSCFVDIEKRHKIGRRIHILQK